MQESREELLVAELKVFRRRADGRGVELAGSAVALEVELQRWVEAGLEASEAVGS
ncbi:hypothetical protein [Streptomyces sp. NPDC088925]|uniref:hypothetical protein n=1 Tax=Streptomyces sp. NPDC088925 TaxID=3365914 RepID=UPI00381CB2D2